MQESTFTSKIHRLLPKEVYAWKISDRFHRGIPDAYYSGQAGDLWVEYKFYHTLPTRSFRCKLSPHQLRWLNNRHAEGRHTAVIIGDPKQGIVLENKEWISPVTPRSTLSHADIAAWITKTVTEP
jgi:hypothetical protein